MMRLPLLKYHVITIKRYDTNLKRKNMTDKICIYHGNCADGFTAAWLVNKATTGTEFVAGFYQTTPPDVTGKIVYMVDFSYTLEVMKELTYKALRVIHIDHHDTAIRALEEFYPAKLEKFYSPDNTESGAMLTWRYFWPDIEPPMFVKHIDDRDRWQFKLPGTREIQANVFSYDYTFENWDMLFNQDVDEQIREGTAIERAQAKNIKELMGVVVRRVNIAGFNVPCANIPYMYGSDMCMALAKNEPFAVYYYDTPEGRIFGLRSDQGAIHVGDIAKQFNGGGHEHASGFKVSYADAQKFEI
jgi:oligoribonuclease NrnB/cAMP/cGMP phosphodiesterase (DHH superfamily)